MVICENLYFAR